MLWHVLYWSDSDRKMENSKCEQNLQIKTFPSPKEDIAFKMFVHNMFQANRLKTIILGKEYKVSLSIDQKELLSDECEELKT